LRKLQENYVRIGLKTEMRKQGFGSALFNADPDPVFFLIAAPDPDPEISWSLL
jgi:hypothetical protein